MACVKNEKCVKQNIPWISFWPSLLWNTKSPKSACFHHKSLIYQRHLHGSICDVSGERINVYPVLSRVKKPLTADFLPLIRSMIVQWKESIIHQYFTAEQGLCLSRERNHPIPIFAPELQWRTHERDSVIDGEKPGSVSYPEWLFYVTVPNPGASDLRAGLVPGQKPFCSTTWSCGRGNNYPSAFHIVG